MYYVEATFLQPTLLPLFSSALLIGDSGYGERDAPDVSGENKYNRLYTDRVLSPAWKKRDGIHTEEKTWDDREARRTSGGDTCPLQSA